MQFRVSIAPGLFQNLMDSLLKGLPGVTPLFNDVLIVAPTEAEFAVRLHSLLCHFTDAGLKVKREKCLLGMGKVDFLGFTDGIHPSGDKVAAI